MALLRNSKRSRWKTIGLPIFGFFLLVASLGSLLSLPENNYFSRAFGQEERRFKAPSLEGGIAWINTKDPIDLKDMKGRIVLLDFWTLCCINCIHTLPDLAKLEQKYPGVLVVIGIHSPKFPNEKKTESIRKAVLRYEIKHPVVNDADMAIWRRYGVRAWPTLALIDPEGYIFAAVEGEGGYEYMDKKINELLEKYKGKNILKRKPLPFQLARQKESPANLPLYFPGKILADANSKRLFIADSTHHRVVITDLNGKKIAIAGSGEEGQKDGTFAEATFSDPQGMTLVGDTLYVADRKNHMIRALDLKKQTVKVVAGTGKQNRYGRFQSGPGLETGLNSPWDLLYANGKIYIAMAGHHQIWTYDLKERTVAPYAGDGRENLADGPLDESSFAQPSGLTTDGTNLYVADSEISAIRKLPMNGKGKVETLVGEGLFEFGDKDGKGDQVRLQHALGAVYKNGLLYLVDTYNSKLKTLNPKTREATTIELKQPAGEKGPLLNEPGGLSFAGDQLFIADTNSHRIRVVNLTDRTVRTLPLDGVSAPTIYTKEE